MALTADYPTTIWDGLSLNGNRVSLDDDQGPDFRDWQQIVAEVIAAQQELKDRHYISKTNDNAGTIPIGSPVYIKSDGDIDLADADGSGTRQVFGLAAAAIATAAAGLIQTDGTIVLTTAEWDAVADTTGGLTPGAVYYLSNTVGEITGTAPSTATNTVYRIGVAESSTKMRLRLQFEKTV